MGRCNILVQLVKGSGNLYIKQYNDREKDEWNSFVGKSRNGHFFFFRDYMEYNSGKFQDFSLMIYDSKDRLIGLLPATVSGNEFISHGGLTFGGIIVDGGMTIDKMLKSFCAIIEYLRLSQFKQFIYKCMPAIYNKYPSDEALYALFRQGAELYRRDVSFAIYIPKKLKYHEQRRRAIRKGYCSNYDLQESSKYTEYMEVMDRVLVKYHGIHPVHNANELIELANKFPDNIKLYVAEQNGKIIAGTVVFIQSEVVHTQYLANSDVGRTTGALDCLIDWLVTDVYKDKLWFDFGIANEQQGWFLNTGLANQKEGFGARAVVHDFYKIQI